MLRKSLLGLIVLGVFSFCGAMNDFAGDLLREAPKEVSLLKNQFVFSIYPQRIVYQTHEERTSISFDATTRWTLEANDCFVIYRLDMPNCVFGEYGGFFVFFIIKKLDENTLKIESNLYIKYLNAIRRVIVLDFPNAEKKKFTLKDNMIANIIYRCIENGLSEILLFFELASPENFKHEFNKEIFEKFSDRGELCCRLVILPCLHCFNADKILPSLSECPICGKAFSVADKLFFSKENEAYPVPFFHPMRDLILSKELHRPYGWAQLENIF